MKFDRSRFPKDFLFGAATAAYQIEGHAAGGAGESIWDDFAKRGGTRNGDDGAIACDHYHRYEEDLDLLTEGGFDAYRFSFSWSRLYPDGRSLNETGWDFYDRLIDAILSRNLKPYATGYHWDLPQALGKAGGWDNQDTAKRFAELMSLIAKRYGDRLESLATINEPWCVSWLSHFIGEHAPGIQDLGIATRTMHNILLAHGLGMEAVRAECNTPAGIVLNFTPGVLNSDKPEDQEALAVHEAISNEWFVSGIMKGVYPDAALNVMEPLLPDNWQKDMACISAPIDFMGINFYTSVQVKEGNGEFPNVDVVSRGLPTTDMGWEIEPDALSRTLEFVASYTGDIPLYITENGMASATGVDDQDRIEYFESHTSEVAKQAETLPVKGYFVWSLLDNFEWAFGYDKRFGIVHVDYETQVRTPKNSFRWWQEGLKL